MAHDWFLDVLDDLRAFAVKNGLHAVSAQLEEVHRVAEAEIAFVDSGASTDRFSIDEATGTRRIH